MSEINCEYCGTPHDPTEDRPECCDGVRIANLEAVVRKAHALATDGIVSYSLVTKKEFGELARSCVEVLPDLEPDFAEEIW